MIEVNSQEYTGYENITVAQLLEKLEYKTIYIAVEMNGEILPKASYGSTVLHDGDVLEVVNFVGGG